MYITRHVGVFFFFNFFMSIHFTLERAEMSVTINKPNTQEENNHQNVCNLIGTSCFYERLFPVLKVNENPCSN